MKKIFNCILIFALFLSSSNFVNASESLETSITEPYVYKTLPGTEEWKKFNSLDEKIEATQIPVSTISKMTTTALVKSVLDYPLLLNMAYFSTYEAGYESVKSYFYGLQLLEKRTDASSVLLNQYKELEVITEESYDYENFIKYKALEILLAQPVFYDKLTQKEKDTLNQLISLKYNLGSTSNIISTPFFYKARQEYINEHTSTRATVQTPTTVYTPNGTAVSVYRISGDELSNYDINGFITWENQNYPNAVRLDNPTNRYNCHSYAWYLSSITNNIWMPYPSGYMSDGSYSNATQWSPRVNARIFYSGGGIEDYHSGIVTSAAATWYASTVTSKWGAQSLMSHIATDCPYTYAGARFYYR